MISPGDRNVHSRTVIVAPMTTGAQAAAFRIPLTFQGKTGLVLLDQVRTLDKLRLVTRVGVIHPTTMHKVLSTLQAVFAPV